MNEGLSEEIQNQAAAEDKRVKQEGFGPSSESIQTTEERITYLEGLRKFCLEHGDSTAVIDDELAILKGEIETTDEKSV